MSQVKTFPTLYKYAVTGAVQEWTIKVSKDKFFTISGQQGGKLTTSMPTYCEGKNIGRANETSAEQQAQAEAEAKWTKKVNEGYNETLSDEKKFFEPMLAHDVAKYKKDLFKVRTFVQPKLDGLRVVNESNTLMSRNGKPYVACPHLYQNDTILDGELYSHEYKEDFNKIVSLCKKLKPTAEEIQEAAEKVEMWVYDFPSHKGVFSERYAALKKWWLSNTTTPWDTINFPFVLVPTHEVKSWKEVQDWHEKFLEEGYEGTIVRMDLGPYENKRSKQLLKYKDFVDEEFELVGAEEGTGGRAGTIGKFWVRLDKNKPYSIEDSINVCKSNIKGDFDFLKDVWKNKDSYIGTEATIKFFNRTPDGALRFPYVIKLNRAEYE